MADCCRRFLSFCWRTDRRTISSVSIYNANGQKVGFKMVDGTQTSLNVSHLAAGTYFVATESGAGKSVTRFIKK